MDEKEKITQQQILEQFERINFAIIQIDNFFAIIRHNNNPIINDMVESFMKQNFEKLMKILDLVVENCYLFKTTTNTSATKMQDTFELLNKYLKEDDKALFMLNWFVFMSEWHEIMVSVYDTFDNKINRISLN